MKIQNKFIKIKRKIKNMIIRKLKSALLAEAISIYDKDNNLEPESHFNIDNYEEDFSYIDAYKNSIKIDEKIKLNYTLTYRDEFSAFINKKEYVMDLFIYVENVQMAQYSFKLDLLENKEIYRPWNCIFYVINHPFPDKVLEIINNWTDSVIYDYEMKIKKEAEEYYKQKLLQNENEKKNINPKPIGHSKTSSKNEVQRYTSLPQHIKQIQKYTKIK